MILSTILNLFITPVLYAFISGFEDRLGFGRGKHAQHAPATGAGDGVSGTPSAPQPVRV
jgi:hypothetical protein